MSTTSKIFVALTEEEGASLLNFIGKCVVTDAQFPSEKVGIGNISIQELYNKRTVSSLREFGKFINRKLNDFDPDFSQTEPLKFGQIQAAELVKNLKLMIKELEGKAELKKKNERIKMLETKRADLKTPEELRKEIDEELAALKA